MDSIVETTVGKIKIGAKLIFGKYGVSTDEIAPIVWLKATQNGDFITAKVLDYLCFDARECNSGDYFIRVYGNPDYGKSNIMQFLNSDNENWWNPSHDSDVPPDINNVCKVGDAYHNHYGFLYFFEDYEIDSLAKKLIHAPGGAVKSLVRLPSHTDLVGESRFQLFSRRGVRANGTDDCIYHRGLYTDLDSGSYIEFWLSDQHIIGHPSTLNRRGDMGYKAPYRSAGLRPVCTLNPDTVLEMNEDGSYQVKQVVKQSKLFTDDEFFGLLGVARP